MVSLNRYIAIAFTALFFLCGFSASAQSLTIEASDDTIGSDEQLTIILDGELGNFSNYATLPDVPGMIVVSHNESFNYSASSKSATVHQTYTMKAISPGDYVIGPAWIQAGSRRIYSGTVHVHVSGGGSAISSGSVFLRVEPDKKKVYAGEKMTVYVRLYVEDDYYVSGDYPIADSYSGFWTDAPDYDYNYYYGSSYSDSTVYIKGRRYNRRTLLTESMYPNAVGEILLPTYTYTCYMSADDDDVYSYDSYEQSFDLKSEPSSITVLALPDHDSLPGFSGDVGKFKMRCIMTEDSTSEWDPVNLTMWITGDGNFTFMMPPVLSLPAGLRSQNIYSIDTSIYDGYDYTTAKMFRYSITPEKEGEYDLSSIAFSYFDAKKDEYVTLHSDSFHLKVTPGVQIQSDVVNNLPGSFFEKKEKDYSTLYIILISGLVVIPAGAYVFMRYKKKKRLEAEEEEERQRLAAQEEYPEYVPPPDTSIEQSNALLHGAGQYLQNGLVLQCVNNLYEAMTVRLAGLTKMRREEISANTLRYKLQFAKIEGEVISSILEQYEELKLKRYTLSPSDGAAAHVLIVRTADLIRKMG